MDEFVTWTTLGTYAGAVTMVTLITQFIKQFGFMKNINNQIISYVISVLINLMLTSLILKVLKNTTFLIILMF